MHVHIHIHILADPEQVIYNRDMDALNRFCTHNRIPGILGREFRRYVAETKKKRMADSRTKVLKDLLSPGLKLKAAMKLNKDLFEYPCFRMALKVGTEGEEYTYTYTYIHTYTYTSTSTYV